MTYDKCPRTGLMPYPVGFRHDLSIITGDNLPANPTIEPDQNIQRKCCRTLDHKQGGLMPGSQTPR